LISLVYSEDRKSIGPHYKLKRNFMKITLLLALLLCFISPGFAQMPGWNHIQAITVTENTGNTVTNYQLRLTVDTQTPIAAGEMLPDGSDIRFSGYCNGDTPYSYWIESGINTSGTIIWVKTDTLYGGEARAIYMHYGNSAATAISAINTTFFGPNSATDSVTGGGAGGVTGSQRGIRFAANEDLLVTSFGKNEPNGSTRYVTLFDNATQSILRQSQVSGPAGQYVYSDISSPIWLNAGQQYILEMYQGSTDGYYFGPSNTQIGQHLTYLDMRYCNGCDQNTFPTNYLNAIHYGYPDLWYYIKTTVTPAPTYVWGTHAGMLADMHNICLGDTNQPGLAISPPDGPYTFAWSGGPLSDPAAMNPDLTPADTTEYFVQVTNGCGLIAMDSIVINVRPLPVIATSTAMPLICNGEYAELVVGGDSTYTYFWTETTESNDTIIVMPSQTQMYHVMATTADACSKMDSVEVTVNVPFMPVHDVTICANQFHTVGMHSYNLSGTYTITLAGITNCDSIVTTNLTVTPLPTATHDVLICYNTSYTIGNHTYLAAGTYIDTIAGAGCDSIITTNLSITEDIDAQIQEIGFTLVADVGADSYAWVDCDNGNAIIPGATGSFYEATANGSYAALLTTGNCTKISNCITIATIGLEELDAVDNISVFPNPNNGTFEIQSSVTQTVHIVDALGQVIGTIAVNAGQTQTFEFKNIKAGIYFLTSRTKVVRVVVE